MPLLSGMLIASDVPGAPQLLAATPAATTVHLIGASALTELYAKALASQRCGAELLDGTLASLNRLVQLHRLLSQGTVPHQS